MRRVLIRIAYDGSAYHGFAKLDAVDTIAGRIETALCDLCGESVELIGGSRTDAGVHAKDNVAVFDVPGSRQIPAEKIPGALNVRLPEDIRIKSGIEVPVDFHPRHCDTVKTYEYKILNSPLQDPLRRNYTRWVRHELDEDAMHEAVVALTGEHDFTSFCNVHAQSSTRIRTIYDASVVRQGDEISIRVSGNGFLYNMVRIIAGTLIETGEGKRKPEDMKAVIEAKDRGAAGITAPPQGLCLMEYRFVNEEY
ncbi:MAG: tRNA pseudouridine(38-40) synthase TruA [Lachnospiraceae bacterium]|nr:tRNA pseudouridine(38-40) synthase TruA [Lachnospiraceae bacterium]